ncbi:MAG: hypothetical protein JWM74_2353 [Myxococcaceae bacterium]|nr:hypothetical protein [Myxococcaceae bacterium]
MIREERAQSVMYDTQTDVARIVVQAGPSGADKEAREVDLLLDAKGHLVGVDLGGEGFKRKVVMLGPHESVASTRPARITIAHVAGQPDEIAELTLEGARAAIRAHEKNPYV